MTYNDNTIQLLNHLFEFGMVWQNEVYRKKKKRINDDVSRVCYMKCQIAIAIRNYRQSFIEFVSNDSLFFALLQ